MDSLDHIPLTTRITLPKLQYRLCKLFIVSFYKDLYDASQNQSLCTQKIPLGELMFGHFSDD